MIKRKKGAGRSTWHTRCLDVARLEIISTLVTLHSRTTPQEQSSKWEKTTIYFVISISKREVASERGRRGVGGILHLAVIGGNKTKMREERAVEVIDEDTESWLNKKGELWEEERKKDERHEQECSTRGWHLKRRKLMVWTCVNHKGKRASGV
jgi:hypothetical protein